jgi:hypothetical protein
LIARIFPISSFSAVHCARRRLAFSRSPARILSISATRSFDSFVFSFSSAFFSISSDMIRRSISSIAVGTESISVRSFAAASSTRSMALSGRKRSVM